MIMVINIRMLMFHVDVFGMITYLTGKSDPYCEITMGAQEHKTKVIPNTLNPKWNASMQFTIRDLHEDVLCITVYDRDLFTPNGLHYLLSIDWIALSQQLE